MCIRDRRRRTEWPKHADREHIKWEYSCLLPILSCLLFSYTLVNIPSVWQCTSYVIVIPHSVNSENLTTLQSQETVVKNYMPENIFFSFSNRAVLLSHWLLFCIYIFKSHLQWHADKECISVGIIPSQKYSLPMQFNWAVLELSLIHI